MSPGSSLARPRLVAEPATPADAQRPVPVWARPGPAFGISRTAGGTCHALLRLEADSPMLWRCLDRTCRPTASLARLRNRAATLAGRTLVHEVNGKIMGISCMVDNGTPQDRPITVVPSDRRLLEDALDQLQHSAAFTALALKPVTPGPSSVPFRVLSHLLQKGVLLGMQGSRPPEVRLPESDVCPPMWAAHAAMVWTYASAGLLTLDALNGHRLRLDVTWSHDDLGGRLTLHVHHPVLSQILLKPHPGSRLDGPAADWVVAATVHAESLRVDSDGVLIEFTDPAPVSKPLRALHHGGELPGLDEGRLTLPARSPTESVLAVVVRHLACLESFSWGDDIPEAVRHEFCAVRTLLELEGEDP